MIVTLYGTRYDFDMTASIIRAIHHPERERFFVSKVPLIWVGDDWFIGPDRRWRTSRYRYFNMLSPFDWWRYLRRNWPTPAVRPLTLFERSAEPTRYPPPWGLNYYTDAEYAQMGLEPADASH